MAIKRKAKVGSSPLSPLIVEWKKAQEELRKRLIIRPLQPLPRLVAGADAAFRYGGLVNYQLQFARDRHTLPITRDYMAASEKALSKPARPKRQTADA